MTTVTTVTLESHARRSASAKEAWANPITRQHKLDGNVQGGLKRRGKRLVFSLERNAKISAALRGRVRTELHSAHISSARKGKKYPKLSLAKKGIPRIIPDFTPSGNLSYILGVIKGDGWVHNGPGGHKLIGLGVTDSLFASSFSSALARMGLHPHTCTYPPSGNGKLAIYRVEAYSMLACAWFLALNESAIRNLAEQFPRDFLRGFYESEGSYARTAQTIAIGNTKDFLTYLTYDLVQGLGLHPTVRFRNYPTHFGVVSLNRRHEAREFINLINPVIRRTPKCD